MITWVMIVLTLFVGDCLTNDGGGDDCVDTICECLMIMRVMIVLTIFVVD